jgi:outer membrane protein insertion porin family
MIKKFFPFIALIFSFSYCSFVTAQESDSTKLVDYSTPHDYIVDTVIVTGTHFLDKRVLANMSGFSNGAKITIPGDDISKLIRKYWDHGLFEDVQVSYKLLSDNKVALTIFLKERPRISKLTIEGISKSDKDDLKEKINLRVGSQITENVLNDAVTIIKKFYTDKGFFNVNVDLIQKRDTIQTNRIALTIKIDKNKRVKIAEIHFFGNKSIPDAKLKRAMKKTKIRDWKFWNSSKFIESDYKDDKDHLIETYNQNGYRDAKIVADSFRKVSENRVAIYISIYEGNKYYFRNIKWVGNTKYPSDFLSHVLTIKKGDVFNQKMLDKRLQSDDDAVSSLYLDNGYLFFNVTPTEVAVNHDSIDFEMRMYEGRQATINNIIISGNTKTNDNVVRREIKTLPGELFSKSDIIRTVRELANLGHFEPEKIEPVPIPNPGNSTVDIEYKLVERANDQLEVSGGWGQNTFIGTAGIRFANFSYSNFFNWKEWRPVPSGDGQTLSIRVQSNGTYYRSYNATFADPWFGGKKPNSFSLSFYYSRITPYSGSSLTTLLSSNPTQFMQIIGTSIALGRRLHWPDDYFTLSNSLNYEFYNLKNYPLFGISSGVLNNLTLGTTISRSSVDQLIYPRTGSTYSLAIQMTPPYSLFNHVKYTDTTSAETRYRWLEYHKEELKTASYISLIGNLVLMTQANFGMIGLYNNAVGYPPIGKFQVGGSGLVSYSMTNVEIIALRGYEDGALTPTVDDHNNLLRYDNTGNGGRNGGNLYDKFTAELRYPVTLKEQATIYGLVFAEGGNSWNSMSYFNPFDIKRSLGFGVRVFLPMFGLLGFDMAYGFDYANPSATKISGWQPHFTMGQQF